MIQYLGSVGSQFLANLAQLRNNEANVQAQVSSGYRVSKVSDDPGSVSDILQLESDLGRVQQVTSNLNAVKGTVDTAETTLENATNLLQQVATLGVQGANSTLTADQRAGIASQLSQILTQLVSASQTQFGGSYVFGGDQANSPSYQVNLTSPEGVDRLHSSTDTGKIQDSTGVTFADSRGAQDIFDHRNADDTPASDNIFAAVNSLRLALLNNDQAGITGAITGVHTAQDYLSQQLAFYGGVQNQVASALDVAQKFSVQDQTALSALRSTDMASAAVALSQTQTSMQAAIQAESALPKTTLFDLMQSNG